MMGKQMRDEIYLILGNLFVEKHRRIKSEKKNESEKAHHNLTKTAAYFGQGHSHVITNTTTSYS